MKNFLLLHAFLGVFICCARKNESVVDPEEHKMDASFKLMTPEETGITFSNFADTFHEDYKHTIFVHEFMYNGCGVAAGDVNGDSLTDLYFTSTFGENKLYLNKGDFHFEDVTSSAGVSAAVGYKTGTVIADINGDGKLDIYVCRSSNTDDGQKNNHTFINTGNKTINGTEVPVFEDQSAKLGLQENSNSVHACFLDFDRDGDLDLFVLNHRLDAGNAVNIRLKQDDAGRITRITAPLTPFESNQFFRNDKGHFIDISEEAGVKSSAFGLSVTTADLNQDGWMDLYVANDYIEPDLILINNKNGTFTDRYDQYLKHSSQNSMGSDIADINNDGLEDIIVLDMKPDYPIRYKMLTNGMQYDRYNMMAQYGYGRQVGRNVLQLNNGNNTFSEIGQYAGVSMTDWSWGPLIADFNNDGWEDIYIANGYRRDITNLDYENFTRDSIEKTGGINTERYPTLDPILSLIPENKQQNRLFINNKNLGFIDASASAGMNISSYSNGAAYADLDNDGDLDLIVNNIQLPAFIYRNDVSGNHWIEISLSLPNENRNGIGTYANVYAGDLFQRKMLITNKGFLSSSEPILHFGLGKISALDSVIIEWPDGTAEIQRTIQVDKRIMWKPGYGNTYQKIPQRYNTIFEKIPFDPKWQHQEDKFVDFKREKLIPYMLSMEGPCISAGDINGDKLDDIFIGNGSGFPADIFVQKEDGTFHEMDVPAFRKDSVFEDVASSMADFDQDGDLDLIVGSGGNAFQEGDERYMTRYYVNSGQGQYTRKLDFPVIRSNTGAILHLDYDNDHDEDLIIAGRCVPGRFPETPKSYLLKNQNGKFIEVTASVFPELYKLGMISDMKAADLNGDQKTEVVFAGDWMPVSIFSYDGNKFVNQTTEYGMQHTSGWWKSLTLDDVDGDGDIDILAGNIGLNSRLVTDAENPITLISNDFDENGSVDPILCYHYKNELYPFAGRDGIIAQIPKLRKNYVRYTAYASATISDIFDKKDIKNSQMLTVNTFETSYFLNENHTFLKQALPYQVQLSPTYDFIIADFNKDQKKDILLAGNFKYADTETGEMDAGNGVLLIQKEDGSFRYVPNIEHGFWAQQEVRNLQIIKRADGKIEILTANNQGPLEIHLLK